MRAIKWKNASFAERIAIVLACQDRGWTAAEAARHLKLHPTTVKRWGGLACSPFRTPTELTRTHARQRHLRRTPDAPLPWALMTDEERMEALAIGQLCGMKTRAIARRNDCASEVTIKNFERRHRQRIARRVLDLLRARKPLRLAQSSNAPSLPYLAWQHGLPPGSLPPAGYRAVRR